MKTLLLAGGTGPLGVAFLARLLMDEQSGWRVVAPTRRSIGFELPNLFNPVTDVMSRSNEAIIGLMRESGVERVDQ